MIQELNTDQLNKLCKNSLLIDAIDKKAVVSVLSQNGYSVDVNQSGKLEIKNDNAINHPEDIARILVYAGVPPTLLMVEEEDLESYFLRTIGMNGGAR